MKSRTIIFSIAIIFSAFFVMSVEGKAPDDTAVQRDIDIDDNVTPVLLPSPASVKIYPDGRFFKRIQGNIQYLKYQYHTYGTFMLESYASRHYTPGKLLERIWDGEYAGKWLDAATRTAVYSSDSELLRMVDQFAENLLRYQQPDGYMGVKLPTNRELNDWEKEWDNWNQWNCMIGFLTHYELRGDRASLKAAAGIGQWIVTTFSPIESLKKDFVRGEITNGMTNVVIIGQIMRLYNLIKNERLLDFVGEVIRCYPPIQQMLSSGEPYLVHPYMLSAVLYGVLEYALVQQDRIMLGRVEQVWDGLARSHLFPTGSLGEREDLDADELEDVPDGQLQETCATTEWIFLTQRLYAATGRIKYADALEQTCYNALLAAQSEDGMKWCYWTPLRYSKHFLYGPTRCCFWSGPKGIARLPQLIYATKGNRIYVNFFESSQASLKTDSGQVQIKQDSSFPETGQSSLLLKTPSDWKGTLHIRVPGWSRDFKVQLNGQLLKSNELSQGYYGVNLSGSGQYRVEVSFGIPLQLKKLAGNQYVMCRGPEVLSIDARDNIDTWLGAQDELVSLPQNISLQALNPKKRYQWAGPVDGRFHRRRYLAWLHDQRTSEPRAFILTPYADAGNEGAAFRTAFPLAVDEH